MFKRFWQGINERADAVSVEDPRGSGWKIASQSSSARLSAFRSGFERRRDRRTTVPIYCNLERR